MSQLEGVNLNPLIDYTYLRVDKDGFSDFITHAKQASVASLCVYPEQLKVLKQSGCEHRLATVINFPSGHESFDNIRKALKESQLYCDEYDIVFPYRAYLEGNIEQAFKSFEKILGLLPPDKIIKVILETGAVHDHHQLKQLAEQICHYPVHYLKTSTGKISTGATPEAANLLINVIKKQNKPLGLKVSGGIRTRAQALIYLSMVSKELSIPIDDPLLPERFRIGSSQLYT